MKPLTDDEVRRGFHAEHTPNVLNTMLILLPVALALWGDYLLRWIRVVKSLEVVMSEGDNFEWLYGKEPPLSVPYSDGIDKSKTYGQHVCPVCGLWTVWVDKTTGIESRDCSCHPTDAA